VSPPLVGCSMSLHKGCCSEAQGGAHGCVCASGHVCPAAQACSPHRAKRGPGTHYLHRTNILAIHQSAIICNSQICNLLIHLHHGLLSHTFYNPTSPHPLMRWPMPGGIASHNAMISMFLVCEIRRLHTLV